jgi:hypothetical protein
MTPSGGNCLNWLEWHMCLVHPLSVPLLLLDLCILWWSNKLKLLLLARQTIKYNQLQNLLPTNYCWSTKVLAGIQILSNARHGLLHSTV